jgi:hypothetical protein
MANTYSAPGAPIGKNLSKVSKEWSRSDVGSRPGRPDFKDHAAGGSNDAHESRKWGGDVGNVHPED